MDAPTLEWFEIVARLGVAALLGAVVGVERGSSGHEAGLRTHVLVSVGSALFAMASVGAFDEFVGRRSDTNVNIDVTRMAAYVAPGIGFIGAGVIVKNVRPGSHSMVLGLTTAASLWTVAAIGVAAGLGFWLGAVVAAAVALIALVVARPVSGWLESRSVEPDHRCAIEIELGLETDVDALVGVVAGHAEITASTVHRDGDARSLELELRLRHPDRNGGSGVGALTAALASVTDLERLRITTSPGH